MTAVNKAGTPHQDDTHKRWGVAIFVLYLMQLALGAGVHFVKVPLLTLRGRAFQNYFHAVTGLLIIAFAMFQVRASLAAVSPQTRWS